VGRQVDLASRDSIATNILASVVGYLGHRECTADFGDWRRILIASHKCALVNSMFR
jgi:hypothetical protein